MFGPNESVLVCLSGGADSVALFCVLNSIREKLGLVNMYALHVNHNLRDASVLDELFVKKICDSLGIPLKIHSEDVKKVSETLKIGIEEAARHVRYRQAEITATEFGASKIAIGHNRNDNAETILMNLCRGSGLRGLTGIPAVNGRVVRPLLLSSREEILAYLHECGIHYVTDESNENSDYTRNRVRNIILPALAKNINPNTVHHVSETSGFLSIDEEYLYGEAKKALTECLIGADWMCSDTPRRTDDPSLLTHSLDAGRGHPSSSSIAPVFATGPFALPEVTHSDSESASYTGFCVKLDTKKINELHYSISSRVMRLVLENFGCEVNRASIKALLGLSKGEAGKVFKTGAMCAVKKYAYMEFTHETPKKKEFCHKLKLEEPTHIPEINKSVYVSRQKFHDFPHTYCTKLIKCGKMFGSFEVRSRRAGDRISLETKDGRFFTRKLQDFFTDKKIPAHERDLVPLFVVDGEIAWVVMNSGKSDIGITCRGFKAEGNKDLLYVTIGGGLMSECADGEKIEVLLSEETIKTRVKEMAHEISGDYRGKQVTLIGTLKGAVFFLTDLSRELGLEQEIDFVKASSYGKDSVSSGDVKIELYPSDSIKDKHVLWIEDIIDTGNTAVKLSEYIQEQKPASLALVSLLDKPSRRVHRSLRIDYLGFTIPDEFVVGYGLDYAGRYRNLPYVGILRFKNK